MGSKQGVSIVGRTPREGGQGNVPLLCLVLGLSLLLGSCSPPGIDLGESEREAPAVDPEELTSVQAKFNAAISEYTALFEAECSADEGSPRVGWDKCLQASESALSHMEATWRVYKALAERVLEANQLPPELDPELYRHYIDTVQAWLDNQRQQAEQMTSCIEERGLSKHALVACVAGAADLAVEGIALSREIQRLSSIVGSL